jgi:hypothetical protein
MEYVLLEEDVIYIENRFDYLPQRNKVVIENGEIKTIFNEETMRDGYMSIEECRRLSIEHLNKLDV